ncbi:hypothetical protein Tco_0257611 [Tanacetum coccineum]
MSRRREIVNANEVVKCDKEVFVKVISIPSLIVSFSMRDVDQITGRDDESLRTNPFNYRSNYARSSMTKIGPSRTQMKRMSLPEIWEAKKLKASSVKDYPMYHYECAEKEVEVELNEDEPACLERKTKYKRKERSGRETNND